MIKCKICNNYYKSKSSIRIHIKKQHGLTYKEYQIKFNELKERKCLNCNKNINDIHHSKKYCSDICKRNYPYEKKYGHIKDIPRCRYCNMPTTNLTSHLNRIHNISVPEYMKKFNLKKEDVFHKSYLQGLSERTKGEKNPAYNHGGKYSPFSKNFIYYDEEKRQKTIDKASKNRTYNTQIEYFLEESNCNGDLAEYLRNKRQITFSKEKCIKKHGKEDGLKIGKDRQEKGLGSLNSKPQEEIDSINRKKTSGKISKNENEIFSILKFHFGDEVKKQFSKNGYVYDIKIGNKIIEYNGDYGHCNPDLYEREYFNKKVNLTASEIGKRDKNKLNKIKKDGYDVFVIGESDYKKYPNKCIEECLNGIKM